MPLDEEILQRLRDNDFSLRCLSFIGENIGTEKVKLLAAYLERNTSVTWLNLCGNSISAAEAKALAAGLEKNTSLTALDLRWNQIGDTGAKALAEALNMNTALIELDLRWNKISDAGAKALAEALDKNTSLISLNCVDSQVSDAVITLTEKLIKRNQQYLEHLQSVACKQLRIARTLLYKVDFKMSENSLFLTLFQQLDIRWILPHKEDSNEIERSLFLTLPLELREKIASHAVENVYLTGEQQRLILDYAEGKIAPVADKLSFFRVTKCDRIRKQINQHEIEAAYYATAL